MCLIVMQVPKTPIKRMECWKAMTKLKGRWVTPFRDAPHKNGVLVPNIPSTRKSKFRTMEEINGKWIHAFTDRATAEWYIDVDDGDKLFRAIAYDVVAFGNNYDLVCRKLVIPELRRKKA